MITETMYSNNEARIRWVFLIAVPVFALASTTDLHASGFNTTEIAKCMVAKSPYYGELRSMGLCRLLAARTGGA